MAKFACPTCQKPVEWSAESPWRPFCSDRCRLIDLGAWMTERHAIPGEKIQGDPDSPEDADSDRDAPRRH